MNKKHKTQLALQKQDLIQARFTIGQAKLKLKEGQIPRDGSEEATINLADRLLKIEEARHTQMTKEARR